MIKLMRAEWMKMRGLCLLLPVLASTLLLGMSGGLWFMNYREGPGGMFSIFSVQYFFLSMTMMLSITILASVAASAEHEAAGWKLLCALPVSKPKMLVSKFIVVFLLAAMEALLIAAGTLVMWKLASNEPVPWDMLIKQPLYCLLAAAAFASIQVWLSAVCPNQSIPIGLGVVGSVSGLFLARSSWEVVHYLPWTYPALSTPLMPDHLPWVLAGSLLGGLLLMAGARHFAGMEW